MKPARYKDSRFDCVVMCVKAKNKLGLTSNNECLVTLINTAECHHNLKECSICLLLTNVIPFIFIPLIIYIFINFIFVFKLVINLTAFSLYPLA